MFESNIRFDQIYPTRSSPYNQGHFRQRHITLKKVMMVENPTFMQKVSAEVLVHK